MSAAPLGDGFAGTRLQRVSGKSTEPTPPPRIHCPNTNRPDHLWWGYHCRLDKTLQTVYGITCDDYHFLLALQGGVCGVCGGRPRRWRLVLDHNHEPPYEVRGLLHFTCNRLLPMVGVLAWWWMRMVRYLNDPPAEGTGMGVPADKARRLEAKAKAKRERKQQPKVAGSGSAAHLDKLRAMTRQGG